MRPRPCPDPEVAESLRPGSHACGIPWQPSNVRASSEMWGTGFLPGNHIHMLAATPSSIWLMAFPLPNFRVISRVPTQQDRVACMAFLSSALSSMDYACLRPTQQNLSGHPMQAAGRHINVRYVIFY